MPQPEALEADFARHMQALMPAPPATLAVAVSGGADSMALCLLLHQWAAPRNVTLIALTVDHGLRPESAGEARQVGTWLAQRGIDHHILTWQGEKPTANKQAAARDARYGLLAQACRQHHIHHLLLAHHQDDQAETFLIRLGRGSGVDGLSAMHPQSQRNGLTLLRPLLEIPKAQLEAYLRSQHQDWVDDPSNQDPAYTRSRMRALLPQLEEAGVTPHRLATTASRMARARDYLEQQTRAAMADCLIIHEAGYLLLDYEHFGRLHDEIALRVLAQALALMNGRTYRPRFSELNHLFEALESPRTLAGCKFEPVGDKLLILREPAAIAPALPLTPGEQQWDHRFRITSTQKAVGHIAALGENGLGYLRQADPQNAALAALPRTARLTLPALWHLEKPIYVPHIAYKEPIMERGGMGSIRIDRLGHLGYT